jgi:hypothetical protein
MSSNNDINNFWENDIWNINIDYIYNKKIKNIIIQINKLNEQLSSNKIFSINEDLDFKINDKHEIKKKITKIKKDNIYYLKTHSDCILEYHFITQKYLINKSYTDENTMDSSLSEKENLNIDYDNYFKKIYEDFDSFCKYFNNTNSDFLVKLKINIDNNINNIYNFIKKHDKPILLIDVENVLKSQKTQKILLNFLSKEDFDEYFKVWFYGYFQQYNNIDCSNISLTEYSTNIKYIEPYISLNLSFLEKKKLISIIINNYFQNYNVISVITSTHLNNNIDFNLIESNMLFIPIIYKKNNIREQDDHLLLFLYYHFRKLRIRSKMITNDKFRWFPKKIHTKNIFYEYDFDNSNINLIIQKSSLNDIYTIENKKHKFIFINYPLLNDKYINIKNKEYNNLTDFNYKVYDLQNIESIFKSLLKIDILKTQDINEFDKILDFYLILSSKIYTKFNDIFIIISKYSKKDIFTILLNNTDILKNYNLSSFDEYIKIYQIILDSFIIIKSILYFQLFNKKNVLKIIKIATNIFSIYDELENDIHKIRKLSYQEYLYHDIYLKFNSLFIYFKKNKFLKKNFK